MTQFVHAWHPCYVFINGCFDILHPGHIRLLQFGASRGKLIVGINADSSIKMCKGRDPIMSHRERKEMLEAIDGVYEVYVFSQANPICLIEQLHKHKKTPSFVVKGHEYKKKVMPEKELLDSLGTQILYFDSTYPNHTTEIIKKCQAISL